MTQRTIVPPRPGQRLRPGEQWLKDNAYDRAQATGDPVPVGLGPQPMNPSQPRAANPNRRIILPGSYAPPADAIPYDEITQADIAQGGTTVIQTAIVPDTYTFRIAGLGFSADDESALRFLSWTMFADPPKNVVNGYANKAAGIGSVQQLSDIFVILGSSVTVTIRATNNADVTVTYRYYVRMRGWFYQEREVA
jgi:hypothetical protein